MNQAALAVKAAAEHQSVEARKRALRDKFRLVRSETERRASRLSAEEQVIQSMPDASPAKWHRAHTTWFFEQFLLAPHGPDYRVFDARFAYLYNSYYVAAGPRYDRPKRGLITRPDVREVGAYRAHVDAAVEALISGADDQTFERVAHILEIGLNHEQQHQELMLTDILHAFSCNPTAPVYDADWTVAAISNAAHCVEVPAGIHIVGHETEGFSFDNESPAHRALINPVRIGQALVTNREWLAFIEDGGYTTPSLWLSDGFAIAQAEAWGAPGYWRDIDGAWLTMGLGGLRPVDPNAAVCHISYYEADAFARWSDKQLPTEFEWEVAAKLALIDDASGTVWQWTRSAYLAYPGYRAIEGALGEYNGKFMINQMVLRGSSCVTPDNHSRATYRNFFYPQSRWQFTGLRLAEYLD